MPCGLLIGFGFLGCEKPKTPDTTPSEESTFPAFEGLQSKAPSGTPTSRTGPQQTPKPVTCASLERLVQMVNALETSAERAEQELAKVNAKDGTCECLLFLQEHPFSKHSVAVRKRLWDRIARNNYTVRLSVSFDADAWPWHDREELIAHIRKTLESLGLRMVTESDVKHDVSVDVKLWHDILARYSVRGTKKMSASSREILSKAFYSQVTINVAPNNTAGFLRIERASKPNEPLPEAVQFTEEEPFLYKTRIVPTIGGMPAVTGDFDKGFHTLRTLSPVPTGTVTRPVTPVLACPYWASLVAVAQTGLEEDFIQLEGVIKMLEEPRLVGKACIELKEFADIRMRQRAMPALIYKWEMDRRYEALDAFLEIARIALPSESANVGQIEALCDEVRSSLDVTCFW